MLWWLLLLLIPLLVHLFNFRKYKKVLFSNTQFLRDVSKQTKKTKQLKKYLLLSTRSLLIACLVIAFAIPYCGDKKIENLPKNYLIYLDNSASMQNQLESAKNKAREIAKLAGNKDKLSVVTADKALTTFVTKEECIAYLDAIELCNFKSNLATLSKELSFDHKTNSLHGFVISDFQSNMFQSEIDSLPNTWFIPVKHQIKNNVGIDSLSVSSPLAFVDSEIELNCWVHNYGKEELNDLPLSLFIDNRVVASSTINMAAEQLQNVKMKFSIPSTKEIKGNLTLGVEDMAYDNEMHFVIENKKQKINVLMVGESNSYLKSVFKTEKTFVLKNQSSLPESLKGYQLIIINGYVANADQNMILRNFIKQGGNVLLVPSKMSNQLNFSYLGASTWSSIDDNLVNLSKIDFKHPIFKSIYKSIPKNPVEPRIKKHYRMAVQGQGVAILSSANEHPILTETKNGAGKVYQFAVPIDQEWSDLPLVGYLFYPTISNIALGSSTVKPLYGMLGSEKPIEVGRINLQGVEQFLIENGNEQYTAELVNRLDKTFLLPNASFKQSGIYSLKSANEEEPLQVIALNTQRDESNLDFLQADQLSESARNAGAKMYEEELINHPVLGQNSGVINATWKWFILFALIFILIEIFLLRFIK